MFSAFLELTIRLRAQGLKGVYRLYGDEAVYDALWLCVGFSALLRLLCGADKAEMKVVAAPIGFIIVAVWFVS